MNIDEYRFMCWLKGQRPDAKVVRNLLREQTGKLDFNKAHFDRTEREDEQFRDKHRD